MNLKMLLTTSIIPFLISCTIFSPQNELFEKLDEPTQLDEIDLTITKRNFFSTGWICAQREGYPAFIHPIILTIFGCATVRMKGGKVTSCNIVYCCDFVLEHELRHCMGYDD